MGKMKGVSVNRNGQLKRKTKQKGAPLDEGFRYNLIRSKD